MCRLLIVILNPVRCGRTTFVATYETRATVHIELILIDGILNEVLPCYCLSVLIMIEPLVGRAFEQQVVVLVEFVVTSQVDGVVWQIPV